ncbi:MAG: LemA family protein [Bacilli bacterium]|nr:LemA family protein [Bacilli bacterium]
MNTVMLLILCIIIIVCILLGIYMYLYNRIQDYIVKINEIEAIIDTNLREKYDNISKCTSIIKNDSKIKTKVEKQTLEEVLNLKNKKISNFDLDRKLIEANNELSILKQKYPSLNKNDEIIKISKKIEDYDEKLEINREYYNNNIAEYNKLVKLFPTNIIAKICKYEEKLFFDRKDMSDDDYNDFKL